MEYRNITDIFKTIWKIAVNIIQIKAENVSEEPNFSNR